MSVLTLAIAIIAFNSFVTAQETTNTDKNSVEKRERKMNRFGGEGKRGRGGKHGMRGMRGDRGMRGLMRSLSRLDLTETQKSQVKTILETQRTGGQPLREEARSLMMKRRDGTITEGEKTRLDEIRTEMKNSAELTKNSVLALLTPEQTQKLEQMKAERRQRMEERRQRWQQRRQEKPVKPTTTEDN
jgi:Spy/CpxP family protein refolding chaperone